MQASHSLRRGQARPSVAAAAVVLPMVLLLTTMLMVAMLLLERAMERSVIGRSVALSPVRTVMVLVGVGLGAAD